MSKSQLLDESDYRTILKKCWENSLNTKECLPRAISDWVEYNASIMGATIIPLLVTTAYLSQKSTVTACDLHTEPLILYGLVAGRSGTNKSGALGIFSDLLNEVKNSFESGCHTFDSGTLEGLLKAMKENNESILCVNDEFATFTDNLDRGTSFNYEKSRFLSLYSGKGWSKRTKTNGNYDLEQPRFNMISFTQPHYAAQFAKGNVQDGFFQRFLLSFFFMD